MELIEISTHQFFLGMSLDYTLRDTDGTLLLTKGKRIETSQQLDAIKSRRRICVEIDQTDEGVRAMIHSLRSLDQAGAPIKDFEKFLNIRKAASTEEKPAGTLVQQWGDLESKLGGVLASVKTANDFAQRIEQLERRIATLLQQDANGSQFYLFNRSVTHFGGYSALHSLLCAALAGSLAPIFALSEAQQRSLVCATLTMNVAMTYLQDQLALQKNAPSPQQRSVIDGHAAAGKQQLEEAGVTDTSWLTMVAMHHANLGDTDNFSQWPMLKRMTKILQTVDRYTAAMSPRKSRSGRTARDSVRTVVVREGAEKHDEVGTALVKVLGLSPPGTFVKLVNGETAVVMRRGVKPAEPMVACVLNRNDEPVAEPRLRDSSRPEFAIVATLAGTAVRVNLNTDLMIRLIPR
ncbi:MAG: phosphodiesterase [Rhodoferax sp.]|uniref:HD-GYP domain-containing protein n=1 Tax=Rhodoferax sp. TaxID=50421 RepID=UPI001B56AAED|nr:phosphodiesterase [Rhodoferax sp.]MBP9907095.1 phosphodiesterase [Rhodoferax sp.]